MEIHIRLAGVQLGPYSEKQIREYLSEGLLSPTDAARPAGVEHWILVSDLLAQLDHPADTSPVPNPGELSEAPKRAPDPPPGVTPLPVRPPDSKQPSLSSVISALSKKTLPIGPAAPSVPSRTGQTSKASTSPLVPVRQGTKKVARASLVKALAQNTAPLSTPSGTIVPPTVPSPPPTSTAIRAPSPSPTDLNGSPATTPPEAAHTPLPSLMKALTAKTVPMRAPPTPSATHGKFPVTAPLPTKSAFRTAAEIAPPSPVTESPGKNPVGSSLLEEAKTSPLPPGFQATAGTTSSAKPGEPSVEPAEIPDEEAAPAAPRRLMPFAIMAGAGVALLILYYVWSPYHAAASLRTALDDGVPADLESTIDFPSVRSSLKEQVRDQLAQLAAQGAPSSSSSTVLSILDNSIDLYITPSGISGLVTNSAPAETSGPVQTVSNATAAKILLEFNSQPVKNKGLATVNDFVVDLDVALLHLQFNGLGWKLKRIDLRPDLSSVSSGSSTGTFSPLISPIMDTYLERAHAFSQKGDWKGAIAELTQVLAIDPKSSATYAERGSARQSQGDLDGAIKDYTQAVTLDPGLATAYNERGNVKAAKNDLDGAIADYSKAILIDPSLAVAYDGRGNEKIAKDDLDGAIADYTQAIALDPNLASAYSDRGFARQANGNLDGAIADYTQALALKPKTAFAYYNRGLARQSQGNLEAAIIDYDRALAFDPKIAGAYYNRGNAKNALHDLDGAIADFTQAVTLNPKIALAYCNRGLARQAKGDLNGALADYTQALAIDPKIAVAYFDRGLIKEQQNDPDGAIADSTQALDLDPKNARAYYTRGFAKLAKGNLDGALADLKEFCDLAPNDHMADHAGLYLWLIAKAQNTANDPDQVLSDSLQNSWNSSGEDMATKTAEFLLGRLGEGDYLASAASTDAKMDQGQHCEAWYFAGMKRLLTGDKTTAIDYFHKCIATGQTDYCEYILAQAELQAPEPVLPINPAALPATPRTPSSTLSP